MHFYFNLVVIIIIIIFLCLWWSVKKIPAILIQANSYLKSSHREISCFIRIRITKYREGKLLGIQFLSRRAFLNIPPTWNSVPAMFAKQSWSLLIFNFLDKTFWHLFTPEGRVKSIPQSFKNNN